MLSHCPTEPKTGELIGQEVILSLARPLSCSKPALGPQTVLTVNPQSWEARLERAVQAGADRIFCVFDFDRTVTTSFLEDGSPSLCSHDILGSIPKITSDCKEEMERMSDLYYPIEVDPNLTREEKIPHMEKWYTHTNSCLGSQNITRGDMIKAVADCGQFRLRPGVQEAFQILHDKSIPVIIISAGVGNVIEEVVRQCIAKPNGCLGEAWPNVHVLSNNMLWGEDGHFVEFSEPLIHMFNKSLQDAPQDLRQTLKGRDIGVLCGDGLGDLTMAAGVDSTDVLKFGFLNEKIDARLPKYAAADGFDRIIFHDSHWGAILDDVLRKL